VEGRQCEVPRGSFTALHGAVVTNGRRNFMEGRMEVLVGDEMEPAPIEANLVLTYLR